jgi:hypothetical protein
MKGVLMNIAILIGISEYTNLQNLSACTNDVKLINELLLDSKRYTEILYIQENTTSRNIKSKVIDFTKKYTNNEINEIFIYFSGHGHFDGDEFYYICSDFDKNKIKQTSFENKEFDSYIKLLNPKLTVKVVDACESGMNYVKDINELKDFLNKGENTFKNCYFMYSSTNNQSSYANEKISDFTNEFINSLIHFEKDIRYKDVIDYLSDSFSNKPEQTPFFVIQADLTDIFISLDKEMKNKLIESLKFSTNLEIIKNENKTLFDLIKSDSENYFQKEKVIVILEKIEKMISEYNFKINDLEKFYDIDINVYNNYEFIPNIKLISEWANTKNKENYFVKCILEKKTIKRRVIKNKMLTYSTLMLLGRENDEDNYITKEEIIDIPVSVESTTEIDYNYISIKTKPKYPNLYSTSFYFMPFISKRKILFFTTFATYDNINWNDEKINYKTINWLNEEFNLKDEDKIFEFINEKLKGFIESTIDEVKKVVNFDVQED